jgi:hypothetical protein
VELEVVRPSVERWAAGRSDADSSLLLAEMLLARSLILADLLPEESLSVPARSMQRAWRLAGSENIDVPTTYVLSNLGNNLRRAGRITDAVPLFERVLSNHAEPEELVSTAMLLAKAASSLRRTELFQAAVRLARQHLDQCEPGTALVNDFSLVEIEARGLLQLGEAARARRVLDRRDGSGELLAIPQWRIIFAVTRGEALAADGHFAEAADLLNDAARAAGAIGLPHQLQRILRICRRYRTAYPAFEETIDIAKRSHAKSQSDNLLS